MIASLRRYQLYLLDSFRQTTSFMKRKTQKSVLTWNITLAESIVIVQRTS